MSKTTTGSCPFCGYEAAKVKQLGVWARRIDCKGCDTHMTQDPENEVGGN
jgi:ribosomal protein L37AE/L43A